MARIRTTFGKVCFKVALFLEINVDFIVPVKLTNIVNFFYFLLDFSRKLWNFMRFMYC